MHGIKNGFERLKIGLSVAALVAGCLVAAPPPAQAQERGRCASMDLAWPVRLPDGSVHRGKRLTLCLNEYWTPSAGMHDLKVDGMAMGRFMSRVGHSEGPAEPTPLVVFERDAGDEAYRLVGYAWPAGARMRTFALGANDVIRRGADRRLQAALVRVDDGAILVALGGTR